MTVSSFAPRVRQVVIDRSMGRCERCGVGVGVDNSEIHHRLPRGMGGSRDAMLGQPANALRLCRSCHRYVEGNTEDVYDHGWKVRHGQIPAQVPVLMVTPYGRGPWLLDDFGCYTLAA